MKSLFIAHGSPMVAIEDSPYGQFLDELGPRMERPDAIVIFSAHWVSQTQQISRVDRYDTIYDFGGFPDALYQIKYPAKGHAELADTVASLLGSGGIDSEMDTKRGLDHGAWTLLHRLFPGADVPVVAMSVNPELTPAEQYRIGACLEPIRDQNILVIGSGVTVHNFGLLRYRGNAEVETMVNQFEDWLEANLAEWNLEALFQYESLAPNARLAVPEGGEEHFVPIFYAMGAADDVRKTTLLHRTLMWGVMTNTVYQFGR